MRSALRLAEREKLSGLEALDRINHYLSNRKMRKLFRHRGYHRVREAMSLATDLSSDYVGLRNRARAYLSDLQHSFEAELDRESRKPA